MIQQYIEKPKKNKIIDHKMGQAGVFILISLVETKLYFDGATPKF